MSAGDEVAPELATALDDNPDTRKIYEALSPSHRRRYSEHVAEAVRPETRARRAAKMVQRIHAAESGT